MASRSIGIDLGTSYSCVGVWQNDRVQIIPNDQGNFKTPSYVSFSGTVRLIGDAAKSQLARNPTNTVFNIMRLIGRRFNDPEVQADIKRLPFRVRDKGGKPVIMVEHREETKTLTPEEILSMIFLKMKEISETYLGATVSNAVISVSSRFGCSQRQAIKDACTISGLNVLRIVNKPALAAVTYDFDRKICGERNVLIFHLGGGSMSVSLAVIEEGIVDIKATAGNIHLGGEDFDIRLVNHFVQEFKRKNKKDISSDPRALCRLRSACECAKRSLSSVTQASVEIDSLFEGIDFYTQITRTRFEELCQDLFRGTLEPVEKVLRDSKTDKNMVDDIILVGGSTRIPRIVKLISDFFNKAPSRSFNPEESVAFGAAIQAALLTGDTSERFRDSLLFDVAPISIGIETAGGGFTPIIRRNTTIPTKKSEISSTEFNNQTSKTIRIYEGECARTKDNNFLGKLELTGISPAPRGIPHIEVTIDIDSNGLLNVSAVDKATGNKNCLVIDKIDLSREEITHMISEAEKYKGYEETIISTAHASTSEETLESYVHNLRDILQDDKLANQLDPMDKFKLECVIDENISWLDASRKECQRRQQDLEALAKPIISRLNH